MIQPITIANSKRLGTSNGSLYTPRYETSITHYFTEITNKKYDAVLTKEDERKLFERIKNGEEKAKNILINSNLRFVISIAKHYLNQGLPFEDLVNEGNIGLIKAMEGFDPIRNIKFISYAVWWIRQSIMQAIIDHGKTIRIPTNKKESLNKVNKIISKLEQSLERKPTIDEILELSEQKINDNKLNKIQRSELTYISFDCPISSNNSDDGGSWYDIIPAEETKIQTPNEELANELNQLLHTLPTKERVIIEKFFGVFCEKSTLDEIGEVFNCSRERVRQIKDAGLRRLRNSPNIGKLIEYSIGA